MKNWIIIMTALVAAAFIGCTDETTKYIEIDNPPAIPQNVRTVTGNDTVFIYWLPVQDKDLDYYRVWWSQDDSIYHFMAATDEEMYIDTDVDNGTTYYYAVSAVDSGGHESEPSYQFQAVYDTPRPEGTGLYLIDANEQPSEAGYDFSQYAIVAYDDAEADIYVDYDINLEAFFINAGKDMTDIQDMGYTSKFSEIDVAPDSGWSTVGWLEIIPGHTYVVWTSDNHFAKLQVSRIIGNYGVEFHWGYQTAIGNPELARPAHDENYMKRTINGVLIK